MVYIAPLPQGARRPRVGSQQDEQQSQAGGGGASQQQLIKQAKTASSKTSRAKRSAAACKQRQLQDQEPDPRQLLAYQAALASTVLQREQAAMHPAQQGGSGISSPTRRPDMHQQLQQGHAAGPPAVLAAAAHRTAWQQEAQHVASNSTSTSRSSKQQLGASSHHHHTSAQQTKRAARQHAPTAAVQQQGNCRQHPDKMQQQQQQQQQQHHHHHQQHEQLLQQQKQGKNHMFWDVPPKAVNPAQVPGLMDAAATAAGSTAGNVGVLSGSGTAASQAGAAAWTDSDDYHNQHHYTHTPQLPPLLQQQPLLQPCDVTAWSQHDPCHAGSPASPPAAQQAFAGSSLTQQPQLPDVPPHVAVDRAAELTEALRAAEREADPQARQRKVKDLKQQLYKVELEQQIAEREAARRASKAAAVAKEAADAAARAAAPPPWDPAAKLGRRGGGGEPHKGVDGAPVADLRNHRHMLPLPGLEPSPSQQQFGTAGMSTHQPELMHPQHAHSALNNSPARGSSCTWSPGAAEARVAVTRSTGAFPQAPVAGGPSYSSSSSSPPKDPAAATAPAATKGFMNSLSELRAGPSHEQRAAAAAARLQLQRDLEAQMADKAARAAAAAAAEAARTAAEDAALHHYLLAKSSSQADVGGVGKESSAVYAAAGPLNVPAAKVTPAPGATAGGADSSGSGRGCTQVARKGRSTRVIDAPWLDQLQPCQQRRQQGVPDQHSPPQASQVQQQQQQQQHALMNRAQQHAGEHQQHARMSDAQAQGLWQEASSFNKLAGAGGAGAGGAGVGGAGHFSAHNGAVVQCSPGSSPPAVPSQQHHQQHQVSSSLSGQALATALQQVQQLQQQQMHMWEEFKQQTQELQQQLTDKQAVAADRDAARAELCRVQELLTQQKQLQEMYASQQQALLALQQQQQQQQHQVSTQQSDQLVCWPAHEDCLDAFVVETQMVPVSVNSIAGGGADTQAASDVACAVQQSIELPVQAGTAHAANRQHKSRYSSFYGLEAETSSVSVASQAPSPKGKRSKAVRARVGGSSSSSSFSPRAPAPGGQHASVSSSLAASTSFVPFSAGVPQQQERMYPQLLRHHEDVAGMQDSSNTHAGMMVVATPQQQSPCRPGKIVGAAAVAAAAAAVAPGRKLGVAQGLSDSSMDRRSNKGSPPNAGYTSSPSRGRQLGSSSSGAW